MKYLIISDIHGSSYYLRKVLNYFDELKCDKILILGDILYHGPRNDLPKEYNPKEVIKLLNPLKDKIIAVKGNCDGEVDSMVLNFPILDLALVADGFNMYMTHGHHFNPENRLNVESGSVVLYGHTHVHKIDNINGVTYLNPGSISLAKGDLINSFAIKEDNKIYIYDLNMNVIMEYTHD